MLTALKNLLLPASDVEVRGGGVFARSKRPPKTAKLVRIDRGLCRHTCYPRVTNATFINERQAVRLKAQSTAPFHNSDFALLWGESLVSVFFWDRDRITSALSEAGVGISDQTIMLPSNFFEPAGRNVELRSHEDGVELQVWDRGALRLSRWWQAVPTQDQVSNLLETLELAPSASEVAEVVGTRQVSPARMSWRNLPEYVMLFRRHFVLVAVAINVAFLSYALGGVIAVSGQQADLAARQAAIKPQEAGVIEARKKAIESGRWLEAFESIRGPRSHLPVMNTFLSAIEPMVERVTLQAWEYESGRLAATLRLKGEIDVRQLVKALESKQFKSVNAESNAGQSTVRLMMNVAGGGKQ